MIRYSFKNTILFLLVLALSACDNKDEVGLYSIYQLDKYKNGKPVVELDDNWKKEESLMETFPKGIEVYSTNKNVNDKASNIYIVAFNPKHNIEFKPVLSNTAKTPSDFYSAESGEVYACLNGGFFTANTSLSLVMYNTATHSVNTKSLQRPYNGTNTAYYPTRAVFGLSGDFVPSVSWAYSVGAGNGTLYKYPEPSPNSLGLAPQPMPSPTFPSGASAWAPRSAIGGAPMLIYDGTINITDSEELAALDNNSKRARSAIGHLSNGNIILLVAEGAQAGDTQAPYHGLTLNELAEVMLDIGCVGALNLDGGGSSSLVIGGNHTITPSDKTGERKVVSALILKNR